MIESRYEHVECRKSEGAHYTPDNLANFMAKSIVDLAPLPDSLNIADPAVGDGELIISLLNALGDRVNTINVYAFDTNEQSLKISKTRILELFPNINFHTFNRDFLEFSLEKSEFSFSNKSFENIPLFDLLIANPPYIRTQILGASKAKDISKKFGLKGRVDTYQAFLVAIKATLKSTGIAGVVVPNRFLSTKGTATLREILISQYEIKHIWDFGDTKLFGAAVLPAVLLLKPNKNSTLSMPKISTVYEEFTENNVEALTVVKDPIEALEHSGLVKFTSGTVYKVRHGTITYDSNISDVWRVDDKDTSSWLDTVSKHTWRTFKEIGKIRVGIKTTADKVFIHKSWKSEVGYEPELLRTLTTHHVAERFRRNLNIEHKQVLYTHETVNGKRTVVDINNYPKSKEYLSLHREQLEGRGYIAKAKRKWYEIWVPQDPDGWNADKVIFKDISEKPTFWMDLEKTVVNGDCYWIKCDYENSPDDVLWLLLAIANSEFIEKFYDIKFQNKLYSNRRRFITQYVEKFPLPDPALESSSAMIQMAKNIFTTKNAEKRKKLELELNSLVWQAFRVN